MRKRISKAKIGQRNYTSSSVDPKKLIVIAFEGNLTELEYFSGIKEFRDEIGLHSLIEIEMLDRIDTRSDPESVKKLVEEYENNPFSKEIFDCLRRSDLCETLDEAGILLEDFMHDKLDDSKKEKFMVAANCANLSIELNDTKEKYAIDNKELWIVIDKDRNSEYSLKTFISDCKYNIVLSNPCFELWLLLHLTNIDEYNKNDLLENNKISKNHRFISKEISDNIGFKRKSIPLSRFEKHFKDNINFAIEQSKKLETDLDKIVFSLGTNVNKLIYSLKNI